MAGIFPNKAGKAEDLKDKGKDNARENASGNPFTKKKRTQQVPPQAQAIMNKMAAMKQGGGM